MDVYRNLTYAVHVGAHHRTMMDHEYLLLGLE